MQITKLEGLHLTATNKRHIAEMLTKGMTEGGTKTIYYTFTNIEGNTARLTITKKETNDWGNVVYRRGHYAIAFRD